MSLFLDIGQGAGLAGATGVRPWHPPLVAGGLGRADAGVDFEGTSYEFLENPAFLAAMLALAVAAYWVNRSRGIRPDEASDPVARALGAVCLALGALLFAGSLADGGQASWPGLPAGAAVAALGYVTVGGLFARARRRLRAAAAGGGDGPSGATLDLFTDGIALGLAGLAILVPPVGLLAVAAFAVLLVRSRRGSGGKYEGLRILR